MVRFDGMHLNLRRFGRNACGRLADHLLVLDALPGNAAEMLIGADSSPEAVRAMTIKLGLDQPLVVRYKKLKGVWAQIPQFENDFSEWTWE
jgi:hypothetical protein